MVPSTQGQHQARIQTYSRPLPHLPVCPRHLTLMNMGLYGINSSNAAQRSDGDDDNNNHMKYRLPSTRFMPSLVPLLMKKTGMVSSGILAPGPSCNT